MRAKTIVSIAAMSLVVCSIGCGSGDEPDSNGTSLPSDAGDDASTHWDANSPDMSKSDGGVEMDGSSGQVDNVRQEDPLEVDEARREAAREAYGGLDKNELEAEFSPEELYGTFNEFALTHFGPFNQPLLTEYTGEALDFVPDAEWSYVSVNSATIAFSTTLPVRGRIEYGTSAEALGETSGESERYFFNQVHHLSDLEPETTYYYRLVARGASGETPVSAVREFTTSSQDGRVMVPGELEGPPYVLDQPGQIYTLTEDIVADGSGLHVAASDVTIDLNGHRLVYANAEVSNADTSQAETAGSGIWARSPEISNVRVVNGWLGEGHLGNVGGPGVHAVYLSGVEDIELAGLSIDYHAAQVYAVELRHPTGRVHIHHNNLRDRGFQILDRHGAGGGRAMKITDTSEQAESANDYEIAHNLIKRTRQNGLGRANSIHDNEIYVDSWSTNSFAIQPHSTPDTPAGEIRGNKIFLTGYHAIALGWAHLDLSVRDNLVQMESVSTERRRHFEDWGDMDSLNGFRITNYGSGGQVRENLTYSGNVIVGRARSGGIMRGTELFSDATITNTRFENNFVHVSVEDEETLDAAPIVTQGVHDTRPDHNPTYYVGDRLVSNLANVRFGDSYGRGNRHTFIDTTFVKAGDHADYHTFVFDGGFESYDHVLIDPVFEDGARVDDVWWRRTSKRSYYTVKWTVSLSGDAGAEVTVEDVDGAEVFTGNLDGSGQLEVPLAEVTIRPTEWSGDDSGGAVNQTFEHQKILHTPHTITVDGQAQSVTVDSPTSVTF